MILVKMSLSKIMNDMEIFSFNLTILTTLIQLTKYNRHLLWSGIRRAKNE